MGSVICTSCVEFLVTYNNFVTICEDTEERINSYHDMQQSEAIIKLSNVLTFLSKGISYNNVNIKITPYNGEHSSKAPDVKEGLEKYKGETSDYQTKKKRNRKRRMSVSKDISQMEMCESPAKHGEDVNFLHQKDNLKLCTYKCAMCAYETKLKENLKRHLLVHKDISEVPTFKCKICDYRTKQKRYLQRHLLVHKDISEVPMYKCDICNYQTKRKRYLKEHLLVHINISEMQSYKCDTCKFQTKLKGNLKRHQMVHKNISEVQTLKCEMCAFHTKQKGDFIQHLLVHTSILEDQLDKFESCE